MYLQRLYDLGVCVYKVQNQISFNNTLRSDVCCAVVMGGKIYEDAVQSRMVVECWKDIQVLAISREGRRRLQRWNWSGTGTGGYRCGAVVAGGGHDRGTACVRVSSQP